MTVSPGPRGVQEAATDGDVRVRVGAGRRRGVHVLHHRGAGLTAHTDCSHVMSSQ